MKTKKHTNSHHKKRHGLHHKRGKSYHNVYLPYLPAILMLIASLFISTLQPSLSRGGVLAYATEMSVSGLLSSTNQKRAANGIAALSSNSKLIQAAQAKANDMVARDYWSHNTPDGQEPWIFIDQAGYDYSKAGENLAYGFTTSSSTIDGWMNSASHRANMLDSAFTEVGFGFKNSENYQSSGNQTVVVAMYAKPAATTAPAPAPQQAEPQSEPTQPQSSVNNLQTQKQPEAPQSQPEPKPEATNSTGSEETNVQEPASATAEADSNSQSQVSEKPISRAEAITKGNIPWIGFGLGIASGLAVAALFVSHGLRLHKLLRNSGKILRRSERFILHHPVLDVTALSLIILIVTLSQSVGVIL